MKVEVKWALEKNCRLEIQGSEERCFWKVYLKQPLNEAEERYQDCQKSRGQDEWEISAHKMEVLKN